MTGDRTDDADAGAEPVAAPGLWVPPDLTLPGFEPPPAPAPVLGRPVPGPPPAFAVGPVAPAGEGPGRTRRPILLGGLVGGLVGALVATGVFLATGVDTDSSSSPVTPVIARNSDTGGAVHDVGEILNATVPAVVAVVTTSGSGGGGAAGTGFIISPDGVVISNNHVVEGASRITVTLADGRRLAATVLGRDPSTDLAVLKVDAVNLPTVVLGNSDQVQVGDDVLAIGNALALDGGLSVTRGIVSGLHREVPTESNTVLDDVIQTDAAINPGNSGGPLVDARGRVVGINTAIADPARAQNVGFAIPITSALPIVEALRAGHQPAYFGVVVVDAGTTEAKDLGVDAGSGGVVSRVTAGTPADQAGIKKGDVIVTIAGTEVNRAADVSLTVRRHKPGDKITVVVLRGGAQKRVTVTLTERPAVN